MKNEKKYTVEIQAYYDNLLLEETQSSETLKEARQLFQIWKSNAEQNTHCSGISIVMCENDVVIDEYNASYENLFEVCDD